jgi:DNA-binding transcriptional LysR family regulator
MLDLRDLRCFVAVYETRGFARAAKNLHTVQSSISTRILKLEREIGAPLFERLHRSIAPTAKGELLYRHALRVLAEIGELETAIKGKTAA